MATATADRSAAGPGRAIASFPAIGTTARVLVTQAQRLGDAVEVVSAQLEQLDVTASRFRADSEVAALATGQADAGVAAAALASWTRRCGRPGSPGVRWTRPSAGRWPRSGTTGTSPRSRLDSGAALVVRRGARLVGGRGRPRRRDRTGAGRGGARPRRDRQGVRGRPGGRGTRPRRPAAACWSRSAATSRSPVPARRTAGPSGWPTTPPPTARTCPRSGSAAGGWRRPRPRCAGGAAPGSGCTTSSTR